METQKKRPIELLAPAGSPQMLRAVIHAGADAVYCGGDRFGARAYAQNFTTDELIAGIDHAHLFGAKVYLTVNTCLKNKELSALVDDLLPLYEAGLDAVLVQDFGVLSLIRRTFPDLAVHASTQMNITGVSGARFLKELGVTRIVAARELSLEEIRAIHEQADIELECFIHGALCYCYSGQCLMSSMLGGRSGNRGRCAGTCRLPFHVNGDAKETYPLSLKDLCTIELLPQIIRAGADSLKIEGRMKSPEYAAGVTSIYRRYLDRWMNSSAGKEPVSDADKQALLELGSRSGFTTGYYTSHNDGAMITYDSPAHTHSSEAYLSQRYGAFSDDQKIRIHGAITLHQGAPMRLCVDVSIGENAFFAAASGSIVETAQKQPLTEASVKEKIQKTGDTPFVFDTLTVELDNDCFVPVQKLNALRREALHALRQAILSDHRRTSPVSKTKDAFPMEKTASSLQDNGSGLPTVTAHITDRAQLPAVLSSARVTTVILDALLYAHKDLLLHLQEDIAACHARQKLVCFAMPHVFRLETAAFYDAVWAELSSLSPDAFLARSYDSLGFLREQKVASERIFLDASLYTYSETAAQAFAALGFRNQTLPLELNQKELCHRDASASELIVYGRAVLMVTANCIHKNFQGCDRKKTAVTLTDRYGKCFPVVNHCADCYNLIFNPDILDLTAETDALKKIAPRSVRYFFTTESPDLIRQILDGAPPADAGDFTRGHFRRGVE